MFFLLSVVVETFLYVLPEDACDITWRHQLISISIIIVQIVSFFFPETHCEIPFRGLVYQKHSLDHNYQHN